jgi:hypothetical protein
MFGGRPAPCPAASAAWAKSFKAAKNCCDCPRNSPVSVKNLTAPMAAPSVSVGRTIEQTGNFRSRNIVGSGMIRFVEKSSPPKGGFYNSRGTKPAVPASHARETIADHLKQ